VARNNVIEILLRAKDQTSGVLAGFRRNLLGLPTLIAGLGSAVAFGKFVKETSDAEAAQARLRNALENNSKAARTLSQDGLNRLAQGFQQVTRFGDDAVSEVQALLLRFQSLGGPEITGATTRVLDLAEAMRIDLQSAAKLVGRALENPTDGLSQLRRVGVQFSAEQVTLIKRLQETGRAADAQAAVLAALDARFKGAAQQGAQTLGGALDRLRNNFNDLFELSSKDSSKAVAGFNALADAVADPRTKAAVDVLAGAFSSLFGGVIRGAAGAINAVQDFASAYVEAQATVAQNQSRAAIAQYGTPEQQAAMRNQMLREQGIGGPTSRGGRRNRAAAPEEVEVVQPLIEEFRVFGKAAEELKRNGVQEYFDNLEESTRTSTQRTVSQIQELEAALEALVREGRLTQAQAGERRSQNLDEILPAFDLEEIRSRRITVQKEMSELSQFMKGAFQEAGRSIQSTLSDAFYEGSLSAQRFKDVIRRTLADIAAAIATSGIQKAFGALFKGAGGGSSGSGGTAATIIGYFGKLFGFAAGGSSTAGPKVVGEDGPELAMGRIYNRRQLAFMGGGGGVTYAPTTSIVIQAKSDDVDELRMQFAYALASSEARSRTEMAKLVTARGRT